MVVARGAARIARGGVRYRALGSLASIRLEGLERDERAEELGQHRAAVAHQRLARARAVAVARPTVER